MVWTVDKFFVIIPIMDGSVLINGLNLWSGLGERERYFHFLVALSIEVQIQGSAERKMSSLAMSRRRK